MPVSFTSRAAVAACVFCAAGLLALAPVAALARKRAEPVPSGSGTRATVPEPSLLYRSGTHVRPRAAAPAVPDVSALSWVVADARTGEVLAAHSAHRKLPPASTL